MYYQSKYRNAFAVPFRRRGTTHLVLQMCPLSDRLSLHNYLIMNLFYFIPRSHASIFIPHCVLAPRTNIRLSHHARLGSDYFFPRRPLIRERDDPCVLQHPSRSVRNRQQETLICHSIVSSLPRSKLASATKRAFSLSVVASFVSRRRVRCLKGASGKTSFDRAGRKGVKLARIKLHTVARGRRAPHPTARQHACATVIRTKLFPVAAADSRRVAAT